MTVMAYTLDPGIPPHVRQLRGEPSRPRARLAVVGAAAEFFRDGLVIAREVAIPLRRLAARNVDDWAQGLGDLVSATGRSVANRLGPPADRVLESPSDRGSCNSEEVVHRALAALRTDSSCAARPRAYGNGFP